MRKPQPQPGRRARLFGIVVAIFLVLANIRRNVSYYASFEQHQSAQQSTQKGQQHEHEHETQQQQQQRRCNYYQAWDPVRGILDGSVLQENCSGYPTATDTNRAINNNNNSSRPHHRAKHNSIHGGTKQKTSFELLQEVLHDNELKRDDELNSPPLLLPSCFAPDFERTHRAVAQARKRWKLLRKKQKQTRQADDDNVNVNNESVVGLPLLNVGMPKSGSSTLLRFVRHDLKWKASHNVVEKTASSTLQQQQQQPPPHRHAYVGKLMKQAVDEGLSSPFALLSPSYKAHTQMDYTIVSTSQNEHERTHEHEHDTNFFPQISLLDEIHASEPNATFVLLFRPIDDWIRSVGSWHRLPYRWMEGKEKKTTSNGSNSNTTRTSTTTHSGIATQIPGLILTHDQRIRRTENPVEPVAATESQLRDWWCNHVRHIRRFADEYPSHTLIELDLYDNGDSDGDGDGGDGINKNSNSNNRTTTTNHDPISTTDALREIFFPPVESPLSNTNSNANATTTSTTTSSKGEKKAITWGKANANPGAATSIGSRLGGPIARTVKYYEQWNHSWQRLEMEKNYNSNNTNGDANDNANNGWTFPKTSLELLETILDERQELKKQGKDWDGECFRPRLFARGDPVLLPSNNTAATATTKKKSPLLSYPILNVGLPMDPWNDALRDFFSCLGLRVVHRKALGSNGKRRIGSVGKKMREAVGDAHVGPVSGFFGTNRQVFSALEHTQTLDSTLPAATTSSSSLSIFPQIQLLDELHEEDPSLTFLLPVPPIDEWVAWAQTFHNFTERWARMEMPGLVLTDEQRAARHYPCPEMDSDTGRNDRRHVLQNKQQQQQPGGEEPESDTGPGRRCVRLSDNQLKDWWCGHVRHVRSFVETYDNSHALVELDLSFSFSLSPSSADANHGELQSTTVSTLKRLFGANQTCIARLFAANPAEWTDVT